MNCKLALAALISRLGISRRLARIAGRSVILLPLALLVHCSTGVAALPKRLILALDGVAYRDVKALQEGVTYKDHKGRSFHRQAFNHGYFPASRMISTFPSTSDVAWTEMLGDRPLPGYQRTHFSTAANAEILVNGVTTTMEYEKQMTWQVGSGIQRALGYIFPLRAYKRELNEMARSFLNAKGRQDNYYAYIRATDDAQHLSGDIFAMLCTLDSRLRQLQAEYRAREGRNLEILILSDHGNNHAGAGKRVEIRSFLKKAGYRLTESIHDRKDVVLPTAGIESWVEIHNAPGETERLAELLTRLPGVDLLTAQDPAHTNRFIVMNSTGERASIEWNSENGSFRYSTLTGDPLGYRPVVAALAAKHQLDAEGFASPDAWMAETLTHRYPLALERIVRGHTRVTLNPATILISLRNDYVHAGWFVKKGSEFVTFGGTHGALDDLNSDGVVLSNFAPTTDTSTARVASLFGGFPGLRDYRAEEDGAEWVTEAEQALTRPDRMPLAGDGDTLPRDEVLLRVWTPSFAQLAGDAPVEVMIERAGPIPAAPLRRGDPLPVNISRRRLSLNHSRSLDPGGCERIYGLPADLALQPETRYRISGRLAERERSKEIFKFTFRTDSRGLPIAY
jgi:hypothetical protein